MTIWNSEFDFLGQPLIAEHKKKTSCFNIISMSQEWSLKVDVDFQID